MGNLQREDQAIRALDKTHPKVEPLKLSEAEEKITIFNSEVRQKVKQGKSVIIVENPQELQQAYQISDQGIARKNSERKIYQEETNRTFSDFLGAMGSLAGVVLGLALRQKKSKPSI